jgi:hypothetical protein
MDDSHSYIRMYTNLETVRPTEQMPMIKTFTQKDTFYYLLIMISYIYWAIVFTSEYSDLSKEMQITFKSKLLLCALISVWCDVLKYTKIFFINKSLEGQTILISEYHKKLSFNNRAFAILFLIFDLYIDIVQIMLIGQFIPFTKKSCRNYSDNLCLSGRFYAICGIINIIFFCLHLMFCSCLLHLYYRGWFNRGPTSDQRNTLLNILRSDDFSGSLNSFRRLAVFDLECPICMQNGNECGDSSFITLNCNHRFHVNCIQRWIETGTNLNCPECRHPINTNIAIEMQV